MSINHERIQRAQRLMQEHGMIGLMIMNQDDYRYFFDFVRMQPRAIIPAAGPPVFISFRGEERSGSCAGKLGTKPSKYPAMSASRFRMSGKRSVPFSADLLPDWRLCRAQNRVSECRCGSIPRRFS